MSNMESFSEDLVPRIVPQPVPVPLEDICRPSVPDVSIIFDKSKVEAPCQTNTKLTYKEWLQQRQPLNVPSVPHQYNTTHSNAIQSPILNKKNVKFAEICSGGNAPVINESATPKTHDISVFDENFRRTNVSPKTNKIENVPRAEQSNTVPLRPNYLPLQNTVNGANQKDVTMADLYELTKMLMHQVQNHGENGSNGLSDQQRQLQRQTHPPSVHVETMQMPIETRQVDVNNYTTSCCSRNNLKLYEPAPQIKTVCRNHNDDEPTVKDLFKIIIKQQEQLIHLQEQVQNILLHNNSRAITETPLAQATFSSSPAGVLHKPVDRAMQQNPHEFDNIPKTIGVMTSFEINIQQNYASTSNQNRSNAEPTKIDNNSDRKCKCCCKHKSQYDEPQSDVALSNDQSSNQQQANDGGENGLNENTGWAFYGNILEQVNDVLQNSPPANNVNQSRPTGRPNDTPLNDFRPSNIRTTTQFKKIGFHCDDVNISATAKRVTFDSASKESNQTNNRTTANDLRGNCSEKSMMMNSLAIKYLPSDELRRITPDTNDLGHNLRINATIPDYSPNTPVSRERDIANCQMPSNLSMSKYRYMEKYGLLG